MFKHEDKLRLDMEYKLKAMYYSHLADKGDGIAKLLARYYSGEDIIGEKKMEEKNILSKSQFERLRGSLLSDDDLKLIFEILEPMLIAKGYHIEKNGNKEQQN